MVRKILFLQACLIRLLLSLSCSHIPCPHTRKISLYSFFLTKLILLSIFRYQGFFGHFLVTGDIWCCVYLTHAYVTMFCTSICLWQPKKSPPSAPSINNIILAKEYFRKLVNLSCWVDTAAHSSWCLVSALILTSMGHFHQTSTAVKNAFLIFLFIFVKLRQRSWKGKGN